MRRGFLVLTLLLLTIAGCSESSPTDPTGNPADATLQGLVLNMSNGSSVVGARVAVTPAGGVARAAVTDNTGRYLINGLRAGKYTLVVGVGPSATEVLRTDIDIKTGSNIRDIFINP